MPQSIVITGMGAITPLGSSLDLYWDGLLAGRSGISRITQFDASDLPCQIAGEVPDFTVEDYMERKEARRNSRCAQMGLAAAMQAVKDAGLPDSMPDPERAGIIFATAVGGVEKLAEGIEVLRTAGPSRLNPFMLPGIIPNLAAFLISRQFQCIGPNFTITTACAAGTQAVGEGAELIRRGVVDVCIVGGTEAQIRNYTIAGFCAMGALPTNFNHAPEEASRPFDKRREGFLFSEGAGALVLETRQHAEARGARIYAEIIGHASSFDGYHVAAPHPDGTGAQNAMRWALRDAGLQPDQLDHINTHGTSTPINDPLETRSIKRVFGDHAYKIAINSTKSMIGHPMGAAGALEAIACALTLYHDIIPPTVNLEDPDPECDLNYTPDHAVKRVVQTAMSNSFGLGGQNACIVLKKNHQEL